MKKYLYVLIFISLGFSACKKDKKNDPTPVVPQNPYFIEGKVDGVLIKAQYVCQFQGCEAASSNYSDFMQWMDIERTVSATDLRGWNIHVYDVDLDTWQLPDTIDASAMFGNEHMQVSFYTGGEWGSDNHFLSDGVVMGDNSFQLIVTSKAGDIVEGTFKGELRNGSDTSLRKHVTEGKFKVKVYRL